MPSMLTRRLILLQLLLAVLQQFSDNTYFNFVVDAALSCSDDDFCEQMIRPGSYCIIEQDGDGISTTSQGVCSNPYTQGCLRTLLPEKLTSSNENVDELRRRIEYFHTILEGRICNSDDVDDSERQQCKHPLFHYPEIRIHNSNWESSIFLSWIYQILLMEILEVPVAVGMGPSGVGHGSGIQDNTYDASFYNPYNTFPYSSSAYPWDGLKVANEIGDCNNLQPTIENVETDIFGTSATKTAQPSCVHVLPEVWNGQTKEASAALREGYIDGPEGNGQVGKFDWYIPTYTASEYDDTLISFYGIRGEKNRHKVAAAFKRPVQWKYYCESISSTNCTKPDTVATHYPLSESEQTSYFAGSQYTGYFHLSDKNNCTKNPTTCTGVIIGPPCTWSTDIDAQIYWNDFVGLVQDGPLEPHGGYSYTSMQQIWRAANATKSNVLMWWWKPDALIEEFVDTPYEFQPFVLPVPTNKCVNSRVDTAARCSADIDVRRGLQEGACDQEAHTLNKIYSASLRELTLQEKNLAYRSPGYSAINDLKITDLQMSDLLRRWSSNENGVDKYGYDPREAVCSWVVDNLDYILDTIPTGYPRIPENEKTYHAGYRYTAVAVASFTSVIIWTTLGATHHYRNKKVMIFAQVYFIQIILIGFGLITIAAIVIVVQPPTNISCNMAAWLFTLGYTIELVPLLVKISAINSLMNSAKKMRRVKISQKKMAQIVISVLFVVMSYLVVWAAVDPLSSVEEYTLATDSQDTGDASFTVVSNITCNCEHYSIWSFVIVGVQGMFLLMATVLAFQSRNVHQEFNESRTLGTMIYSHFMFLLLRIIVIIVDESNNDSDGGRIVPTTIIATIVSLLYSLDTLAAVCIYILPKVREAALSPDAGRSFYNRGSASSLGDGSGFQPSASVSEIELHAAREQALYLQKSETQVGLDIDADSDRSSTRKTVFNLYYNDNSSTRISNGETNKVGEGGLGNMP